MFSILLSTGGPVASGDPSPVRPTIWPERLTPIVSAADRLTVHSDEPRLGPVRAGPRIPLWVVPFGVGVVAVVVWLGVPIRPVRVADVVLVGLGGAVSALVGIALHRPERRRPWLLFVAAQALTVLTLLGRAASPVHGPAVVAVQLTTMLSYVCAVTAILALVRSACGGRCPRAALLDGVMVSIGVAAFVVLEISVPALRTSGLPAWQTMARAVAPLYDIALLMALLQLGFTAASRRPSYRYLAGSMTTFVGGHLSTLWLRQLGIVPNNIVFALPYILATTCFAMSVLHPSMAQVGLPSQDRGTGALPPEGVVRDWTARRMALLVPSLTLPLLLLAVRPRTQAEHLVITVAGGMVLLLVLLRARWAQLAARHARAHDALTGLLTRDMFVAMLSALPPAATSRWVAVVDLDDHRHAVQFWGHATGDALVKQAADRLDAALPQGVLLARVGGDVFATAIEGDPETAAEQAELLRVVAGAGLDLDGLELPCTASVGLAELAADADPVEALSDADTAMYAARSAGGDRVQIFEPAMRESIQRRAALEQALRYAAGEGELSVVYQPVVDLPTGRVIGAEALLRWANPQFGAVPPLEFVQIAEETGLIDDLGSWVLSQSCHRLAAWDVTGLVPPDLSMAVNVSTRQLRDDSLPARVKQVLRETGLASDRLVLEVTESAMHEDHEALVRVLTAIRAVGVRIAVDDFGTGYSSLSYLSRLPVTSVKLDRSLVRDVAVPPGDAIARAVQGIAAALGLTVVAEGVEDDAQRDALNALHIAHAQGYLWGRPLPPKDFLALLAPPGERRVTLRGDLTPS